MTRKIPRILIAGTGSGCGKTTVTCAVLGALLRQGTPLSAFKCGPDYIDPMFHKTILDIPSRNLDLFLCGEQGVRTLLDRNTPQGSMAVIEGVMGFYDGIGGTDRASTAHLSRAVECPVLLVADGRGKALSLAAEVQGYLAFAPNRIAGVILNNVSEGMLPTYREMLRAHCGVEVVGYLPPLPGAGLQSRHLGLVTAAEVAGLRDKMALLADTAGRTIDLERLVRLAGGAPGLQAPRPVFPRLERPVRVGLAWDEAFCFTYADSLDLLEEMGAEIVPFSPLRDMRLPQALQGLLLPGGYPELYAEQLSGNRGIMTEIGDAVRCGLPTIAECGGFLYLCQALVTGDGAFPMAGVLPGKGEMTGRLGRFGYQTLTAKGDNLLLAAGEAIPAHEFHYSRAECTGEDVTGTKPGRDGSWSCIHAGGTLWAGYPHIHFWSRPDSGWRFLKQCEAVGR